VNQERETELARSLLSGEPGAFEAFVEYFRSRIFQYSWWMCGRREDAEEVAQEALLQAFENFGQLREPQRVRSWIFRIARNACLMKRRKSVFAPDRELSLEQFLPASQIADWSSPPEEELLNRELGDTLRRAIAELPETYRAVVLLRDIEELSTEETAHILDLSTDVVKTRLHRGRLAIRHTLDAYLRTAERVP
jgi:RNA polymerase sigma-70 factor (ECF subfamily)